MQRADQDGAVLAGDETFGDAAAGGWRRLGVRRDESDLAPEYATFGVDLVDRHLDAAEIILAAVAVLTAGIAGQAKLDRFRALRPGMILPPRAEEAAGAADDTRHQAALQNASP